MAFNGSGTFNRLYNWVTDRINGVNIRADRMDAEMDGFATGLTNCITKDGQTTPSAIIPFPQGIRPVTSTPGTTNGDLTVDPTAGLKWRANGVTFQANGEILESSTKSGAASYDFTLPASSHGFSRIIIEIWDGVVATNGAQVLLRFSTDNGSTYPSAAGDYYTAVSGNDSGAGSEAITSEVTTAGVIATAISNAASIGTWRSTIDIPNHTGSTISKLVRVVSDWMDSTSHIAQTKGAFMYRSSVAALTNFRILTSAGNVSFSYRIIGVR